MKIFILVIIVATIIGGFVGGELMDRIFSLTGAVIGGIGSAAVVLGLGAYFDAQENKKKKKGELTPEMRAVFDRMLGQSADDQAIKRNSSLRKSIVKRPNVKRRTTRMHKVDDGQAPKMRVVSKIIEVRQASEEAQKFLEKYAGLSESIIKTDVMKLINDKDKTVHSIRVDKMKPDHLALMLITNVIGEHLGSGHYHTYRGVLNTIGNDMLHVWNLTLNALLERGYYTEAKVAEDKKWIKEQVKNCG